MVYEIFEKKVKSVSKFKSTLQSEHEKTSILFLLTRKWINRLIPCTYRKRSSKQEHCSHEVISNSTINFRCMADALLNVNFNDINNYYDTLYPYYILLQFFG